MATKGGRPENLVTPTTEKAREIGRKGGIKSGQVRREKKLLSEFYGELLAELYDIDASDFNINSVAKAILARADSASVALLKEMREATEGNKLAITGELKESKFEIVEPPIRNASPE